MRLEKGYRVWGTDLTAETNPYEAGLGFCVKLDKPGGFEGRDALVKAREAGLTRRLRAIVLDDPRAVVHRQRAGADRATASSGGSRRAATATRVGASIAYAYLPIESAPPGHARSSVDLFGSWVGGRRHARAAVRSEGAPCPRNVSRLRQRQGSRTIRPCPPAVDRAIGLTTYRETAAWGVWDEPADLLPASYADEIDAAGGVALLLPPAAVDPTRAAAAVARRACDGLVLTGGPDVDPARYGARRDTQHRAAAGRTATPGRSPWPAPRCDAACRCSAICRGLQVLNVALGGTLVQHLPDVVGHDGALPDARRARPPRRCALDPHSRLGELLGSRPDRRDLPPPGVDRLGAGLIADRLGRRRHHRGRRSMPAPAWVPGVQWHPEVHDGAAAVRRLRRAPAPQYRASRARQQVSR